LKNFVPAMATAKSFPRRKAP